MTVLYVVLAVTFVGDLFFIKFKNMKYVFCCKSYLESGSGGEISYEEHMRA